MKCGLLGGKLGHSYSPQIHAQLGTYRYSLFEKEPEELEDFLKHGDFSGLNVTVPYKKAVIPFLDELTPVAERLGAVNTIARRPDGRLLGHNTDYFGFQSMAERSGVSFSGKQVLILGTGGAAVMAKAVVEEKGGCPILISRTGDDNYETLDKHADASVIVNATPVGMYPNNGVSPVDLSLFPKLEGVLDLIYNPARTRLLLDAQKLGIPTENGLWMLVAQAKEAAEYFTGCSVPDSKIGEIHRILSQQMQNIILIGMPGCGKTTIGGILAQKTGKAFFDADALICQLAGRSIPEIFQAEGEDGFRRWETEALLQLGKLSGAVIATGGGCVTRAENYPLLHQNGTIFWLQRDIELLPTDGRPLSQKSNLAVMYKARKPLYQAFSDSIVCNDGAAEETAGHILQILEETK